MLSSTPRDPLSFEKYCRGGGSERRLYHPTFEVGVSNLRYINIVIIIAAITYTFITLMNQQMLFNVILRHVIWKSESCFQRDMVVLLFIFG